MPWCARSSAPFVLVRSSRLHSWSSGAQRHVVCVRRRCRAPPVIARGSKIVGPRALLRARRFRADLFRSCVLYGKPWTGLHKRGYLGVRPYSLLPGIPIELRRVDAGGCRARPVTLEPLRCTRRFYRSRLATLGVGAAGGAGRLTVPAAVRCARSLRPFTGGGGGGGGRASCRTYPSCDRIRTRA